MTIFDPERLKRLLGLRLSYQGIPCRVIEILDEEPALVLQDCAGPRTIQANQHGEASRRVPRIFTVALLDTRRDDLNPALAELRSRLS